MKTETFSWITEPHSVHLGHLTKTPRSSRRLITVLHEGALCFFYLTLATCSHQDNPELPSSHAAWTWCLWQLPILFYQQTNWGIRTHYSFPKRWPGQVSFLHFHAEMGLNGRIKNELLALSTGQTDHSRDKLKSSQAEMTWFPSLNPCSRNSKSVETWKLTLYIWV